MDRSSKKLFCHWINDPNMPGQPDKPALSTADSAMGLGVYASSDSPWDRTYAQFLKHGGSWQRTNRPFYASTLSSSSEPSTSH